MVTSCLFKICSTGTLGWAPTGKATIAPQDWETPPDDDGFSSMEDLLRTQHSSVAAVIIEPVVQGAGGMRIYHPEYLKKLRSLCDELDVLLIFDEMLGLRIDIH